MTNTVVYSLTKNSSGYIFAGTEGGGVFRSIQSTTVLDDITTEIPFLFELKQNFPNPFNPSTTIEFDIPEPGYVSLKVFNIAGQEVATLVNNELSPGTRKIQWNAQNISSGLYFYRLETKGYIETKKLVVMK